MTQTQLLLVVSCKWRCVSLSILRFEQYLSLLSYLVIVNLFLSLYYFSLPIFSLFSLCTSSPRRFGHRYIHLPPCIIYNTQTHAAIFNYS